MIKSTKSLVFASVALAVVCTPLLAFARDKVDHFGLRDRLMPSKYRTALRLDRTQLGKISKLDASSKQVLDQLKEEGKNLSHEHGDDEECPACLHGEKVRAAFEKYYRELGKILDSKQEESLRKLVKQDDVEAKKAWRDNSYL
jgi:hypothetical protein